jgi:flavin reductase ActVB
MRSATAFQDALARVATTVSVVTTADGVGRPQGVTVGTLCSLSLDPPLVMFCLNRSSGSHPVLTTASRSLIHVLRDDQAAVAARFAQRGVDRFAGLSGQWQGVPAGDHTIVMCLVTEAEVGGGDPLLSYGRGYGSPLPLLCAR